MSYALVPQGLPELLEAIARAQVVLAEEARKMHTNTDHYSAVIRTMWALVDIAAAWSKPVLVGGEP